MEVTHQGYKLKECNMSNNLAKDLKSWKTSLIGLLGALVILIPQLLAVIDGNPATILSLKAVLTGLAMLGIGVAAKDGDKSTEDVQ